MKITRPGDAKILIAVQSEENEIPASPTFYEVRGTGESASESMETVETGEFAENNSVTDIVNIGSEPKSPFNFRLCGDDAEKFLFENAVNGTTDGSGVLKAANIEKWLTVRRAIINDEGSFIVDTIGCKCASMNFSIVGKQLQSNSIVLQGTQHVIRDLQLGYQDTSGTPKAIFGGDKSSWLNLADGKLYLRTLRTWATTAANAANVFTTGKKWTAVTTDPTVTTGAATWILNKTNGKFFWDTGVALSVPSLIFTWFAKNWISGTAVPTTEGGRDSLYILIGDGASSTHANIYQKIFNGTEDVWTLIQNFNLTPLPSVPWYDANTIIAKSENDVMKFPHLRNFVITGVIGIKSVNDLSFTIENGLTSQHGASTDNIGKTYPNYGALAISRGVRKIKGNFTSYFYNDELQKMRRAGTAFSVEFMISNGTQAWRIIFPRVKFDAGDPNVPNATDAAAMENYTFLATYEPDTYLTDLQMVKVADLADYPKLYHGWVSNPAAVSLVTDHLQSMTNYSGNYEVAAKPSGTWYYCICAPATEPDITSLINTGTNVDEFADYAEQRETQELETGVAYVVIKSDDTSTSLPTAGEIFIINRNPNLAEA